MASRAGCEPGSDIIRAPASCGQRVRSSDDSLWSHTGSLCSGPRESHGDTVLWTSGVTGDTVLWTSDARHLTVALY